MTQPHLFFEFADQNGNKQPMWFTEPHFIIKADSLEEVASAFTQVEEALEKGFYIAGCVSYEAAPAFDSAFNVNQKGEWPLVWFGVFTKPQYEGVTSSSHSYSLTPWELGTTYEEYQEGIEQIKAAIERGDTYQVNYTARLQAAFSGDTFSFYKQLVSNQQSSYSAYMSLGNEQYILSASPELFFRKNGSNLVTRPMKGTARRGRTLAEDENYKKALSLSDKDQAENLMIVDLLRNDVGRLALPGTVKVPELFAIETYPTVHQMTSTVEAQLPENTPMYEIFRSLFPCGSITGAPKVRTMEYIASLEKTPRDVYCGAIGYMTPNEEAVFNVPIRTVLLNQGQAVYGTGGGITWDSTTNGEYEELQTKAKLLTEARPAFKLLETMQLKDGAYPLLKRHIERIDQSAHYFNFSFDKEAVVAMLEQNALNHPQGLHRVRMLSDQQGQVKIETIAVTPTPKEAYGALAHSPIDPNDPFLFHKTTHRRVYDKHQHEADGESYAVLLWNDEGELTEFTIANLVVKERGEYLTPPISSGLLGGTLRGELVEQGRVKERVLYKSDLASFEEIWMVNGLRGWIKVQMGSN
ncbi:aminodeoxychorismate synthase component I [Halobacillus shinanisalinarum]|uniref:Aminodeoxychorismate synthase component I n=1 Tax=Halobacillus shinanisalinarum TaxID=2932258 RepID=A0ABY4H4X6_9BACI|nr:aminodeoxychorismate synthase component I [Halobacillus shinanisalinarum]UOQ95271.1 aminodeoxychorismate synthase component I [Halobacillus shinanisalinarum]